MSNGLGRRLQALERLHAVQDRTPQHPDDMEDEVKRLLAESERAIAQEAERNGGGPEAEREARRAMLAAVDAALAGAL